MIKCTEDRIRCHTAEQVNRLIDRNAENRVQDVAGKPKEGLSRSLLPDVQHGRQRTPPDDLFTRYEDR